MKRFLKAGSIIAVTALCAGLLTGCGEWAAIRSYYRYSDGSVSSLEK